MSRQAYYQHFKKLEEKKKEERWLVELVKQLRKRLPQSGGNNLWMLAQRLLSILRLPRVGRDRFAKLLKENGLSVRKAKRWSKQTTYSNHSYAVQPNRYREVAVTAPNQVLVADITYIPVKGKHGYLFLITDAYSRCILGYHLSSSLEHQGAIKALEMALEEVPNPKGVIHHTDRGVQYCCHSFLDAIGKWEMLASMTDDNHCAQNALAERMNGILKQEFIFYRPFRDFCSAKATIRDAVFNYNHLRLHGSLQGRTPAEVHSGSNRALELWAKELYSFELPAHPKYSYV